MPADACCERVEAERRVRALVDCNEFDRLQPGPAAQVLASLWRDCCTTIHFSFLGYFFTPSRQHSINIMIKTTKKAVEGVSFWLPLAKCLVVKWHERNVGNASEENRCRYGIDLKMKSFRKAPRLSHVHSNHQHVGRNPTCH